MSATIDPTWGVPIIGVIIAAIAITWAKLTAVARDRRYGAGPTKPEPQRPARPSQVP